MPFNITKDEWILTKEEKEPNYKQNNPYTWIAIKITKREELYTQVEKVINQMGINRNNEYISNVKRIEKKENKFIANHINLSNHTRREKANKCWNFLNKRLSKKIVFDTLALRDLDENHLFKIKY